MNQKIILIIIIIIVIIYFVVKNCYKKENFTPIPKLSYDKELLEKVNNIYNGNSFITVENYSYGQDYNLTYGELTFEGMQNIYNYLTSNKLANETFIDLGSGNGRTLFYSILAGFNNSKGVEIVDKRYNFSIEALDKLKPEFGNRIEIKHSDLFKINSDFFPPKTAIFVSNLLFNADINDKLFKFLSDNTQDDSVLFVSKLPNNTFKYKLIEKLKVPMSWQKESECYVLKK